MQKRISNHLMKNRDRIFRIPLYFLGCVAWIWLGTWFEAATPQRTPAMIGRLLTSDAVSIEGRTAWAGAKEEGEDPSPLLSSGNKITFQDGIALLEFDDASGTLGMCGRTSVSLIKSKAAMQYGLEWGTLSLSFSSSRVDRILTPEFALEWSGDPGTRRTEGVVRLDMQGRVCVENISGKLKISDQLAGPSMELPAGASVQLSPGTLGTTPILKDADCGCSPALAFSNLFPSAGVTETSPTSVAQTVEQLPTPASIPRSVHTKGPAKLSAKPMPTSPKKKDNASAEPQPTALATMTVSAEDLKKQAPKKSFGEKVKGFFRRVFSRKKQSAPPSDVE
jgi:hypothetical protein